MKNRSSTPLFHRPHQRFYICILWLGWWAFGPWGCGGGDSGTTDQNGNAGEPGKMAEIAKTPTVEITPVTTLRKELIPFFQLIQAKRTGPARVRLRKYLNLHPQDGQAEFLFGLSYHREKHYSQAQSWFTQAIEQDPTYVTTHYFLGWASYYLGEAEAARQAFAHHLKYQPEEGDSHFGLGLIDLDEGRLEEAQQQFRQAIELQKERDDRVKEVSKAHARLGEVFGQKGEYELARSSLEKAVKLYPDHYEAYYKLFRVLTRLGETKLAEEAKRQFIEARQRVHPHTSFPE